MMFSTARAAFVGSSLLAATATLSACATHSGGQVAVRETMARASGPALMPLPSSVAFSDGALPLSGGFAVSWSRPPSAMLRAAAARFLRRADALAGRVLPAADRPAGPGGVPVMLRIEAGQDAGWLTVRAKEDYRLVVGPDGVTLTADGPDGVIHGLATLAQLIGRDENGAKIGFATIADHPRFAWRGIMIDTSRHFVAVETIERQLDAMEMLKLDVLHLHLSDGTGFRVESHVLPELTAKGSHGQYYTQAQIRDLVAYAADRGIRVVPEFDVPGHALALLLAHPELAATSPVDPEPKNKNTAALDPTLPATLRLVRRLYGEMGRLFPDAYFHSGGDEVEPDEWLKNPKIAAWMKAHGYATPQALQAAFTAEVQTVLASQGKIMVGWDEVSEAPIPADVVVDVWRSSKFIASATAGRHPVIVSAGYYLDLLQPAGQHYLVDPYDPAANGITRAQADRLLKKGGRPDLVAAFVKEPAPPPLTARQKALVLGGEAPLWAELVTDEMLDGRIWPRAAAIAERFWSAADVRDVDDMYRRLAVVNAGLQITGLQGEANRWRMAARLSPGSVDPVLVLASATVPLRNYNMNRYVGRHGHRLDEIGEIATPDPVAATRFSMLVGRYVAGDRGVAPALRRQLVAWRDNDAAFAAVARVRGLSEALVTSRHLAVIAGAGLKALDGERTLPAPDRAILDQEDAVISRSSDVSGSSGGGVSLPAAGLMIAIEPAVRKLLGL
ncbi:beta-N-acetylhexosaminidase [Gluconacetobacter sacchari]|nr:family 20 glycosylhydrolase [Gluconacetobacter sacchari]